MSSFPWDSNTQNDCGCRPTPRKRQHSLFRRIAGATGQWIRDLTGAGSGQLVVRNDDALGYLKPNCEGFVKLDTDGDVSIETPSAMEGVASGNPMGFGYVPFLELFQKEICNPSGGAPTEEQWMRIKALMPQWIATGEIAVMTPKECGSEELRFDFLQPCPLPTNGCPPDGIGYLASAVTDDPTPGGCSRRVRRWYWVSGLSIPATSLIQNESGTVDLSGDQWVMPVLKREGGCWFFQGATRGDFIGDGLLTFRTEGSVGSVIYNQIKAIGSYNTNVAIPGYAEAVAAAKPGTKVWGLFSGIAKASSGAGAQSALQLSINGVGVGAAWSDAGKDGGQDWGERAIELLSPSVAITHTYSFTTGSAGLSTGVVTFMGFQYTPK